MQDRAEILAELKGLKDLFEEKFDNNAKEHQDILVQVTKTNGRVGSLESLKNKIIGALIIINIVLVPILFIVFQNYFK